MSIDVSLFAMPRAGRGAPSASHCGKQRAQSQDREAIAGSQQTVQTHRGDNPRIYSSRPEPARIYPSRRRSQHSFGLTRIKIEYRLTRTTKGFMREWRFRKRLLRHVCSFFDNASPH